MENKELLKKMILEKFAKLDLTLDESGLEEEAMRANYIDSLSTQIVGLSQSSTFTTAINANMLICDLLGFEDLKKVLASALKKDGRGCFGNIESELVVSRAFTESELKDLK